MNKAELTDAIAERAGLSKADAERALNAMTDSITAGLADGDPIALIGFGSFAVNVRKARTGRNPRTGEQIEIPEKKIVKFKAGNKLEEAVN